MPKILEAGVKILLMLIAGIVKVIPELIAAALKLIVTLAGELIRNLPKVLEAGVQLILALIKGIVSMVGQLGSTIVKDIIPEIVNNLKEVNLLTIGKNIIQGLIDGIGSMARKVWDKVTEIGTGIKDKFTSFFDIHSPSRLMRDEVGKQIGAGLVVGMKSMKSSIQGASENLADWAKPDVNDIDIYGRNKQETMSSNLAAVATRTSQSIVQQVGGEPTVVNIYNPSVREDRDIDRIVEKIDDALAQKGRNSKIGIGRT